MLISVFINAGREVESYYNEVQEDWLRRWYKVTKDDHANKDEKLISHWYCILFDLKGVAGECLVLE